MEKTRDWNQTRMPTITLPIRNFYDSAFCKEIFQKIKEILHEKCEIFDKNKFVFFREGFPDSRIPENKYF